MLHSTSFTGFLMVQCLWATNKKTLCSQMWWFVQQEPHLGAPGTELWWQRSGGSCDSGSGHRQISCSIPKHENSNQVVLSGLIESWEKVLTAVWNIGKKSFLRVNYQTCRHNKHFGVIFLFNIQDIRKSKVHYFVKSSVHTAAQYERHFRGSLNLSWIPWTQECSCVHSSPTAPHTAERIWT